MNKEIESIKQMLEEKEQARAEIIKHGKEELNKAEEKLKALKAAIEDPKSLEDYTATAQEIRDTESYIDYLQQSRKNAIKCRHQITSGELEEIRKTVYAEIQKKQIDAAPAMLDKFEDLIELMEQHAAEVFELEEIVASAGRLYTPTFRTSTEKFANLATAAYDKTGYWPSFVKMFMYSAEDAKKARAKNG